MIETVSHIYMSLAIRDMGDIENAYMEFILQNVKSSDDQTVPLSILDSTFNHVLGLFFIVDFLD